MSKPISAPLKTLLTGRFFLRADCYEFTLVGGVVLRYTNGDADLTYNGKLFSAGGIQIGPYVDTLGNKAKTKWSLGTQADTMAIDVVPGSAVVAGVGFLIACQQGVFDGATLRITRLFMPTYGDTRRGGVTIFVGRVAEVDVGRSKATFTINTHMELLDQNFPRNLFQAGCVNNLGDTACGVNLPSLAVAGTALTGSTALILSANLTVTPAGQFDQGKLVFTSGVLNGFSRTVKSGIAGTPGSITLNNPFPTSPANGDTFNIFPGCDKTYTGANGCPKFSNTANWRGEDRIPIAETGV